MMQLAGRFWKKVVISPSGCWNWIGAHDSHGYGHVGIGGHKVGAHRVAWLLMYGPVGDGLHVLHHCDNRSCVRPTHLFLGTHIDNMRDMSAKGRRSTASNNSGSRNGQSRLTEVQVVAIRSRAAAGVSQAALAREFGVVPGTIWGVVSGHYWRHV